MSARGLLAGEPGGDTTIPPIASPTPIPTTADPTPVTDRTPTTDRTPQRSHSPRRSGWRSRWGRLAVAVPAVALAAAGFTAGVLVVDRALQPDPLRGEVSAAVGTELAPRATAKVAVWETGSGFSVVLDADQLPGTAPG